MPVADDRGDRGRIAEAEVAEGLQRLGIVLGAGEDEIAGRGEARRLFEKARIDRLDGTELCGQRFGEQRGVGKAHQGRDTAQGGRILRDAVRLRIVDHLQAMLELAQELIGDGQCVARVLGNEAGGRERIERLDRTGTTQLRLASAPNELLRLREEFDLANTAAAELDVVAGDGDAPAAAVSVDLALDRMDVLDRGEIEILAPEEGP